MFEPIRVNTSSDSTLLTAPKRTTPIRRELLSRQRIGEFLPKDAIRLGKEAGKFTKKFLKKGFNVHTKRVDARGRSDKPRYYAMVEVGDDFLSEALVKSGLARRHGYPVDMPSGKNARHVPLATEKSRKSCQEAQAWWLGYQ